MGNRLEQLHVWGVPPTLIGMADGNLPHEAFQAQCEPLRVDQRRKSFGLNLDQVGALPELDGETAAALWEHDVGDGHAFEIVYCAKGPNRLHYWHVMYADDTDAPTASLVARSEQGLYFWLFFSLIPSEFHRHGERAYASLVSAAKAVGFTHLMEVFRLEEEIASDYDRCRELTEKSFAIL